MRRCRIPQLIVAVLFLASLPGALFAAEERKVSDAFRKEFIENFERIPMNTAPGNAMLLRILIEARGAKRGVEVGSANGYGAINMGIGFERTGGRLVTVDIDPKMVKQCRRNVAEMGLEDTVTVIEGDAVEVLSELEGKFDFVFIDARKQDYMKYFKAVSPKLEAGAVIVADNVIKMADQMTDFLEFMRTSPDYETVIVRASAEKDDGMAICYKVR